MPDLTEFLLARIADRDACAGHGRRYEDILDESGQVVERITGPLVVRDPLLLAELAAKRRVVLLHSLEPDEAADDQWLGTCRRCDSSGPEAQGYPCDTLRVLALPYAAHPDYRPEWRPDTPS